jgi:hypothetical protein
MANIAFDELEILIQSFMIGASTGIILGFSVWCVRSIMTVFRKFF